jgi:soluble lytic murein transglycosylase
LYGSDVQAAAKAQQVSPYLLLGLIRQESSFNSHALSPVQAVGLMQLLPSTANDMAKRQKASPVTPLQLLEPSTNIALGSTYLSWLHGQLQNDPLLVVAAYNAGMGNVAKWVNQSPQLYQHCPDCFVESIPFDETRHYIEHVFEGVQVYSQRYGR